MEIAVEHQATGIVTRMMGRLGSRCVRRGRARGSVILGAPPGEYHGLGAAMLGDLMRLHGWDVVDLGASTPVSSFLHAVARTSDAAAVGLSVTYPEHLPGAEECCRAIKTTHPTVCVVVGGSGVADDEVASSIGADARATSADQFHELLLARTRAAAVVHLN